MGSKSTGKNDYFGRPMKEKFPYYPYGVIIPRCTAGPCNRHPPTQKPNTATKQPIRRPPTTTTSTTRQRPHTHDPECTQAKHKNAGKNTSSSEACKRIAKIVAQELPECKFDPEFLKEIECKCKNYWDTLRRHSIYLDEKQVAKELKRKLQEWAKENKHECCDDDDDDDDDKEEEEDNSGGPSRKSSNGTPSNHEIEQVDDSQNESNLNSTTNQSNSNFYNPNDEVDNNDEDEILDYFDEDNEDESDYMDFRVSRFPVRSWRNVEEEEEEVEDE